MAENTLYYGSQSSNNLGSKTQPIDPFEANTSNVKKGFIYKNYISREPLVGSMPINESEIIYLDPSTDDNISMYNIPLGYHNGTGRIIVNKINDFTFGTATAEDIAFNKTAWVNGKKIIGTLDVNKSEQIGNARPEDIMDTRVAWVNGERVVGTIPWLQRRDINLRAGESYTIPYGLSSGTSKVTVASLSSQTHGTATSDSIVEGDTAWVEGQYIIGTLKISKETVEELKNTNALTSNVLEGKSFYSEVLGHTVVGSMPDHSGEGQIDLINGETWYIPEGYYNGLSSVKVRPLNELTNATATAEDIIKNKTAWVNGEKITGEMNINDSLTVYIDPEEEYIIPEGYHYGTGIIKGKDLSDSTQATATSTDILDGETAWVNGIKITGTIPTYTGIDVFIGNDEHYHIPKGYHDGTGWVWGKSAGSQTPGTAEKSDILKDKTAWVNGNKLIGTMPIIKFSIIELNPGEEYTIPKGYHDGNGSVFVKPIKEIIDGTAAPEDILKGKTAWVNGEKITGNLNLSGATASEEDVLLDKTFFVGTEKKTGTLELTGNATPEVVASGYTFYNTDAKTIQTGTLSLDGDALRSNVLLGKTFYSNAIDVKLEGTMVNNGAITKELNYSDRFVIPEGYHNGQGILTTPSFAASTPGTATSEDILDGKTAWVEGEKVTGTIESKTYSHDPLLAGEIINIPPGYYPNGITIYAETLENQTLSTATADDITEGKTAWTNGEMVTGIIPDADIVKY